VYLNGGHLELAFPWDHHANAAFKLEKVTTSYSFAPYLGGFDSPVYATSAPDDPNTLYVVEQPGTIRIVRNGKIAGTFLDIRSLVVSGGEQGLLSMAFARTTPRTICSTSRTPTWTGIRASSATALRTAWASARVPGSCSV
jgi:hypothetical protein